MKRFDTHVVRLTRSMRQYYVYIMTNRSRTLYTGITSNIARRIFEHKSKQVPGFTMRYNITKLVYYGATTDVRAAITRGKQIKGWLRRKKIALIESMNPAWNDLAQQSESASSDPSSRQKASGLRMTS